MKNILFFSGDITRSGGTERVATSLVNGLYETGSYNISVVSLVEQEGDTFFPLDPHIKRYALGDKWKKPGPAYLAYIPRLKKILEKEKTDILIDIDIVLDVISVPAVRGRSTRVISWEHFSYGFESSIFYRRCIAGHFLKKTDLLVTLTKGDAVNFKDKIPKIKKAECIYNPVEKAGGCGLHDKKQIVWAGRLTKQKGTDYLLEVAGRVLKKYPDWQWLVLGEGEDREKIERHIEESGLENRLILMGRVSNVDHYLGESKIFVMTSLYEGLPMSLLEAKAAGLPCLSFDCPTGPSEILEDGTDGFLIPCYDTDGMADSIGRLISDEALRDRLSQNSSYRLERFSIGEIVKKWEDVFENM